MKHKGHGVGYDHPAEWITPVIDTSDKSVLVNGRLTIGKLYVTKEMHSEDFSPTWQAPFRNYHSGSNLLNGLEHDFVV